LQAMRQRVRDAKRVATCLPFGPRFLHSTGQLYKSRPNTGVFLQIACDERSTCRCRANDMHWAWSRRPRHEAISRFCWRGPVNTGPTSAVLEPGPNRDVSLTTWLSAGLRMGL
jgi:hypothetical protein